MHSVQQNNTRWAGWSLLWLLLPATILAQTAPDVIYYNAAVITRYRKNLPIIM